MSLRNYDIIGWDIGGVNIKAVRIDWQDENIASHHAVIRPFEIWKNLDHLKMVLWETGEKLGLQDHPKMAVTMTAELSDVFQTKREGVMYILDTLEKAFEQNPVSVFNLEGHFFTPDEARKVPLLCAATNWLAGALFIATYHPDCILMDVGSTTTDIVPIQKGRVISRNRTDTQRLIAGELLYTGLLRTNPNTLVDKVPIGGRFCRVAAEYFSCMADVYLILDLISPDEYSCPTADAKAKTVSAARSRLSRLVCSDSDIMSDEEINRLARYIYEKQVQQITESLMQVLSGVNINGDLPLAAVGIGGFLVKETARRLDIPVIEMKSKWEDNAMACFPALSAAVLLAQSLSRISP
jgi:probable H4MPT-linked C1 transfer pathway protein